MGLKNCDSAIQMGHAAAAAAAAKSLQSSV